MRLTSKHVLMMAVWLVTSLALIIFVPQTDVMSAESSPMTSPYAKHLVNSDKQQLAVTEVNESHVATIVVILAKGAIAIILGIFALFCVCSRFGKCYAKRNKAILASTCHPRSSADA